MELTVKNSMYREDHLRRLEGLRLMDDDFMTKVFDGHTKSIELVLQIILDKPDLEVIDVKTQVFVGNLAKRSVRLDVIASDSDGCKYNIEIQRADKGAGRKRARYNSSMMDNHSLDKGDDFEKLPETYVIFITERDILKYGLPIYHVERMLVEIEELFGDEEHILYVNGECHDDTPLGRLMHDFSCTNPDNMHYPILAERTRYFKESKEGREIMCRAFEELFEQGIEQGIEKGALGKALENAKSLMSRMNLTLEDAMEALGLSEHERQYILENIDK